MVRNAGLKRSREADDPAREAPGADRIQILHRLLKLTNRLMAPFSTHLEKRYKIGLNEFRLLMVIGRFGTTASHELAEETGLNTMCVSRSVAALSGRGRIDVSTDPDNRRRKILRLTPEGRKLYEQMLPVADQVAAYLFESLRYDEMLAFDRYVTTITESLEARDEQGRSVFLERTRPENVQGED
ncbi:MAG: MarR family winged helix-turn-helix transcriptional regulator [Sphingomonadales bacterium]